jgi:predicted house-cleaning noncanonical NTP pyrophosphatase (MazG superfamily)
MLGTVKTHHDKLVRDRIPELLAERGIPHQIRVADRSELAAFLNAKLEEETAEYLAATEDEVRIGELADVLEVIRALGAFYGADHGSLERVREQKAVERGAFEARIVLISADTDE